jgi:hypothetical protein
VWSSTELGAPSSKIGSMVLPEFQFRGVAKAAVQVVLDRARGEGRWEWCTPFPRCRTGRPVLDAGQPR